MNNFETGYLNERKLLRERPSAAGWELEVRNLLSGKRGTVLDRIGGVQQYVKGTLEESADPPLAETEFLRGLENVVHTWSPSQPNSAYYLRNLLDLIGAFTPPSGFVKVLGCLQRWQDIPVSEASAGAVSHDLHMRALVVLQNYYPVAPVHYEKDCAFKAYEGLLRGYLRQRGSPYSGHAAKRLLELHIVNTDSEEIGLAIIASPEPVLPELVKLAFGSQRSFRRTIVSHLFNHSLVSPPLLDTFKRVLQQHGATLGDREQGAVIRFKNGEQIDLEWPSSEKSSATYIKERWGTHLRRYTKLKNSR